jgi:two-component system sensor histidine kinase PhoQ
MTISIRSRLFISASVILIAFLGLTGTALLKSYQDSTETAVQGRLQAHVYTLLAAAELGDNNRLKLPPDLPEPRFSSPDSGLIARVDAADGTTVWRSRSMLGMQLEQRDMPKVGNWMFERIRNDKGLEFIAAGFAASWAGSDNRLHRFRFTVAEDYRLTRRQLARFSQSLWGWLGAAGLILLAAQGTILRWSLSPLRQAENEIAEIESGQRKRLSANYPKELEPLTRRLNALVENSEKHLKRYRDSLGNLAHSLKTPLAVLRNAFDSETSGQELRQTADDQFTRVIEIIDHQLQRAATAGRSVLARPLPVADAINKIEKALHKVYANKAVDFSYTDINETVFVGDEGDFYEMMGNLLDNAFKWCQSQVRVTSSNLARGDIPRLQIIVEDDGPGIPAQERTNVFRRGQRSDSNAPGHGLGLDMVRETMEIYNGTIQLEESTLGGLKIELLF